MGHSVKLNPVRVSPRNPARAWLEPRVGRIVGVDAEGVATVDFPGNPYPPCVARSVVAIDRGTARAAAVLLLFENGDPRSPVIAGVVRDALIAPRREEAVVDGERVTLRAEREIALVCGDSSITLRKDGKIIIKGANLLSRSSGANKIRGAVVDIN
jgi:hypothetical protein